MPRLFLLIKNMVCTNILMTILLSRLKRGNWTTFLWFPKNDPLTSCPNSTFKLHFVQTLRYRGRLQASAMLLMTIHGRCRHLSALVMLRIIVAAAAVWGWFFTHCLVFGICVLQGVTTVEYKWNVCWFMYIYSWDSHDIADISKI